MWVFGSMDLWDECMVLTVMWVGGSVPIEGQCMICCDSYADEECGSLFLVMEWING
jgi:hypothetical protein